MRELNSDLSDYRVVARKLNQHRKTQGWETPPTCCDDVHTDMSLKYAHLYNGFAHLHFLDELLNKQKDLFA
ncbi:MAG: hypothetical protein AAF478_10785 [Pseudomonadota bacterium]